MFLIIYQAVFPLSTVPCHPWQYLGRRGTSGLATICDTWTVLPE